MDRFVSRENIKRYRKLAGESIGPAERSLIMKLLAEEVTKFKVELRSQLKVLEGRSRDNRGSGGA
jgi:hypothetical protein